MSSPARTRPTVVHGRVAKIEEPYPRPVRVPSPLLAVLLAAASTIRAIGALLATVLRIQHAGSGARGWKALRDGPEFLVTPVLLIDPDNQLVPLEVHGHMSTGALVRTDRVRVRVHWPRDAGLPARAVVIENLTTGRTLTPRGATLWSHLGVGLVAQALLGLVLIGLTGACLLGWL